MENTPRKRKNPSSSKKSLSSVLQFKPYFYRDPINSWRNLNTMEKNLTFLPLFSWKRKKQTKITKTPTKKNTEETVRSRWFYYSTEKLSCFTWSSFNTSHSILCYYRKNLCPEYNFTRLPFSLIFNWSLCITLITINYTEHIYISNVYKW